jgi:zinc transport system ATP-binding protein
VTITLDDVTLAPGGVPVLSHVGAHIPSGSRIVVSGPNGAGKTTLFRGILRILPLYSGSISYGGSLAMELPKRGALGYVGQGMVQSDLGITGREVVAIGCIPQRLSRRERADRIFEVMEQTGCTHLSDRGWRTLSGGEKQRLSLARCLAQRAEVLILDEPTAGLDPAGKRHILQLLEHLSDVVGISVLMSSHEYEAFERPGWRRLHISGGTIVEEHA